MPNDVKLEVIRDQSRYIEAALHEIETHLILSSILASLVVFIFIRNLRVSEVDQVLVRGMVEVARGLGIRTVAEFVEDQATLELVREYGVDYAQGFHVGRPRPVEGAGKAAPSRDAGGRISSAAPQAGRGAAKRPRAPARTRSPARRAQ